MRAKQSPERLRNKGIYRSIKIEQKETSSSGKTWYSFILETTVWHDAGIPIKATLYIICMQMADCKIKNDNLRP